MTTIKSEYTHDAFLNSANAILDLYTTQQASREAAELAFNRLHEARKAFFAIEHNTTQSSQVVKTDNPATQTEARASRKHSSSYRRPPFDQEKE